MDLYQPILIMIIVFMLLCLVTLIVIVLLYISQMKFIKESMETLGQFKRGMVEIDRQLQLIRHQMEILSIDPSKLERDSKAQLKKESERIIKGTESHLQVQSETDQNESRKTKKVTQRTLAELIDSRIESIVPDGDQTEEHKKEIEVNQTLQPTIQDEILELLRNTGQPIHYKDILEHLSNVFPDSDVNTFMVELERLESMRKIEARVVGGDIHYQLYTNILR